MNLLTIIGISIALAMDAFAVAIASGIMLKKVSTRQTFRLAWHFGFFQFAMPVLGWLLGLSIQKWMENFDHWIAFIFLSLIGGKMIRDSFSKKEEVELLKDPSRGLTMVMLSVATSIDAFAVGLSICLLGISIWFPAIIIGIITCFLTVIALHLGSWLGENSHLGHYAEFIGGIILIAIGIKILWEHGILKF